MKDGGIDREPLKFATLIAHQLQSPLNAVSAALQSVLGEYTGPLLPSQRGSLERANARCDQAIESVRRMLAIVRAGAGRAATEPPAQLVKAVRQAHDSHVAEAVRREIGIEVDIRDAAGPVALSEAALLEVLGALLGNALKYTPDRGRVRLRIAAGATPGTALVEVADSGIGVPEAERDKIFQPFFRSSTVRASGRPGVGLGLAFVKSVVEAAGGQVTVDRSADLGGAAFTIALPLAPEPANRPGGRPPGLRVVIVGGVTAGPKAAAKIVRLLPDADVTIVERGSVLSYAGCGLPYYVSGVVRDQKRLMSSAAGVVRDPVFFRNVMNVHVMNRTEACEIDRAGRRVRVREEASGHETWLPYDRLLLATGASALVPSALRTSLRNVFTLHGMRDAEGIRSALADALARDVAIVGGGLLGIQMTEALARKGARVTILEQRAHILPMLDPELAALVERHLEAHGVRIVANTTATGLQGTDTVTGVTTERGVFPADLVILACGVRPNVELAAAAGLELGATGALFTDAFLRTSDPGIYAAGDCVETVHRMTGRACYIPHGSTAAKQGRVAAVNIAGGREPFPGVMGSSICKVFDYTAARSGFGEAEAREAGHDVVTALVSGLDRAHYMPAAGLLMLKLIVDRKTRRLLGVQATGPGAADKRVDVAMMAIVAGFTVDELANGDLCYAPSYSAVSDNLIAAANVVRDKLDGVLTGITPAETRARIERRDPIVLLDVRTAAEFEEQRLPHATSIPLGALRERLSELPCNREIVVVCDIGVRAYEGALMLKAAGFERVAVMEGGIAMWPDAMLE